VPALSTHKECPHVVADYVTVFRKRTTKRQVFPNIHCLAVATDHDSWQYSGESRKLVEPRVSGDPSTAAAGRPSAPVSVLDQRGASPLQVYLLRPVTDCNCVVVRRGGEQQEVNDQSAGNEPVSAGCDRRAC